jgi:serine/threonine-protein kinase
MGTVYLGRVVEGATARLVAIKVLHPHLATNEEMIAMFLDEARVATHLHHPNLVRVLDLERAGNDLALVMEYVEGGALGALQSAVWKAGEAIPLALISRVVQDALAGLHAMHEATDGTGRSLGLVHRDISPQNLIVGTDGITKITDFGIALAAGRLASTRPDGTVKGKLQYLAPEQVGRKDIDRRADVFAAGIVLWECLSGQRLFTGATEAETLTRVVSEPIPPPSQLRPEIPSAVDEVCLQALERDPARRFPTASHFEGALRDAFDATWSPAEVGAFVVEWVGDSVRQQREAVSAARSMTPARRRFPAKSALALAAAALLAGLATARFARTRATSEGDPREASAASASGAVEAPRASAPASSSVGAPVVAESLARPGATVIAGESLSARIDAGAPHGRPSPVRPRGASPDRPANLPFMPEDL